MNTINTTKTTNSINTYSVRKTVSCWGDSAYFIYKNNKQFSEDYYSIYEAFEHEELVNSALATKILSECKQLESTQIEITKVLFDVVGAGGTYCIDFVKHNDLLKKYSITFENNVYELDDYDQDGLQTFNSLKDVINHIQHA